MPYHLAIDPCAFSFYYILFSLSIIVKNLLKVYILNVIIDNRGGLIMNEKDSKLKYFNNSSLNRNDIKKVVFYLRDSGMKEKEIDKILKEYGLLDDKDEVKASDSYKGKGKR